MSNVMYRQSFAKVNLFLGIQGLRPDGYHELEMVNAKISLHDDVTVRWTDEPGVRLTCSDDSIPVDERNTAHKAATCFLQQARETRGVQIHIHKRIPHGAGLGGGSSNAAAVLLAMYDMCDAEVNYATLHDIGLGIGADVPFFLHYGTCYAGGIGERVVPIEVDPDTKINVVLCSPAQHVETKGAYGLWDRSERKAAPSSGAILGHIRNGDWSQAITAMYNSFEDVIFAEYPEVENTFNAFRKISPTPPRMSGSGSNCFSLHLSEAEAVDVCEQLQQRGYKATPCTLVV